MNIKKNYYLPPTPFKSQFAIRDQKCEYRCMLASSLLRNVSKTHLILTFLIRNNQDVKFTIFVNYERIGRKGQFAMNYDGF